tara:strand:- start:59 stop:1483 length:1425 start_codon:yes stop_codon:yes gene_type:complete
VARLDSKDANNLLRGLGVLNEMLTLSMKDNKSIQRENLGTSKTDINKKLKLETETPGRYTDKQLVVIKKGQENIISQYNNFISMKTIGSATRLDLELSNPSGKFIKFGSLTAPIPAAGNVGEIAEGVFAAALAARFITRSESNTTTDQIQKILQALNVGAVGGSSSGTYIGFAPNKDIPEKDRIELSIVLKNNNMKFVSDPKNFPAMDSYMRAAIQYADRQVVRDWVETIYTNGRVDTVKVMADGISDSTTTKIDVKVEITNDKGRLSQVDINVSLKIDQTALFGQVSGHEFNRVSQFFSTGIQENMGQEQQQYESIVDKKEKLKYIYQKAAEKLISKLRMNPQEAKSALGRGISLYATRDDAGAVDVKGGNKVQLIDLNKGEATIYDFKNVGSLLQNYNFDVKYNVSTDGGMPTIIIEERETNQRLIQFRAMYQNKRKANGQKYLYFRNYVEKGAFLKELIGTSALDNNVTSS